MRQCSTCKKDFEVKDLYVTKTAGVTCAACLAADENRTALRLHLARTMFVDDARWEGRGE